MLGVMVVVILVLVVIVAIVRIVVVIIIIPISNGTNYFLVTRKVFICNVGYAFCWRQIRILAETYKDYILIFQTSCYRHYDIRV